MEGICKLCGQNKVLIKAHIIPESFYNFLYNASHAFTEVLDNDGDPKKSRRRKGLYDSTILCKECDTRLGSLYDDYGSRIFFGHKNSKMKINEVVGKNDPRVRWREISNAEPGKIKLFLLSILWRAHISNLEFFKDVDLGLSHSKKIMKMISTSDAGKLDEYPILILQYSIKNSNSRKLLSSIKKYKKDGKTFYAALLSGVIVFWHISLYSISEGLEKFAIDSQNGLKIIISPRQDFDAIKAFLGENAFKSM